MIHSRPVVRLQPGSILNIHVYISVCLHDTNSNVIQEYVIPDAPDQKILLLRSEI